MSTLLVGQGVLGVFPGILWIDMALILVRLRSSSLTLTIYPSYQKLSLLHLLPISLLPIFPFYLHPAMPFCHLVQSIPYLRQPRTTLPPDFTTSSLIQHRILTKNGNTLPYLAAGRYF